VFLDFGFWESIEAVHGWRPGYIARNLDLSVHFHAAHFSKAAEEADWLLVDSRSPTAADGLASSEARIWTSGGQLLASAHSHLICRPPISGR
jgi:acyl-CoA thioesterase